MQVSSRLKNHWLLNSVINFFMIIIKIVNVIIIREFKKLRRQLQRKRHIKIELCVKLIFLRLSRVDHVVQNRRTALSLAWYEWFSCKGKE